MHVRAFAGVLIFVAAPVFAQQLITNGGFESGSTGWSPSGNLYIGTLSNPHSGSWYAYVSNPDGTPGNGLYGTLSQSFTIPNGVTSATLSFWWSISTQEPTSTPHDFITVYLGPSNTLIHQFDNTNATGTAYQQYTFNLTGFAGQTVTLQFVATTNGSYPTVFRIDDVSATYVGSPPAPPSNLQVVGQTGSISMSWQDNANNETNYEVQRRSLGGAYSTIATLGANVTAYQDPQALGNTMCYHVRATNPFGPSSYTSEACGTSIGPPTLTAPGNNTTLASTTVTLSWQSALGANNYGVDVGRSCGGTEILNNVGTGGATSYNLPVSAGTYVWRVRSANTAYPGLSNPSTCWTFAITAVVTPPVASFTSMPTSPKPGDAVQFTDTSTNTPTSWSWNFGDSSTSTTQNPSHAYTTAGTYTVTLTATNSAGSNTASRQVTVVASPVANFTYTPSSPTTSTSVQFTDTSTGSPTSWSWNFNDGSTSSAQNPSHTFATAKTYAVALTVSNAAGTNTTTKNITVATPTPAPVANFTYTPSSPTTSTPVTFTDTSTNTPTSWNWTFGDGFNGSGSTVTHTFATAGSYTVTLTAANSAGSNATSKTLTVATPTLAPVASFTASTTSTTVNQAITFTDTSTGGPTSWSWNFGDNQTATTQHATHAYSTTGTYHVSLTVANNSGQSTATKDITITSAVIAPVADFTYTPPNPMTGSPVQFTDASTNGPTTWYWDFGDGASSTANNPSHTYATAKTYAVTLTGGNSAGSTSKTRNLTVTTSVGKPVASFTASATTAAILQPITFTDTSTGNPTSWSWNFNDGTPVVTTHNPTHTFTNAGTYTTSLTVTNTAGQDTATRTITILNSHCNPCITITGHVVVPDQIAIRGVSDVSQRSVTLETTGASATVPLLPNGDYTAQGLPYGTYTIRARITYHDQRSHEVTRERTTTYLTQDTAADVEFPSPIVLIHGIFSNADRWADWQGTLERAGYLTITPAYSDVGFEVRQTYDQLQTTFADVFLATPPYNVIAHSKGGIVLRHMYLTRALHTPIGDALKALVLLGSPNLGTDCYSLEFLDGLGRELRNEDATALATTVRLGAVAGTQSSTLGFGYSVGAACPNDCAANDGAVPIDSALSIPLGGGVTHRLDGFAIPYSHTELGTRFTTWVLTDHILPFFNTPGARFTKACPDTPLACTSDGDCTVGHGLTRSGACTIPALNSPRSGVALSWTSSPNVNPVATLTGSLLLACPRLNRGTTDQDQGYNIYRATVPIYDIASATRIAWVDSHTTSYFDPDGSASSYYLISHVTRQGEEFPWPSIAVIPPPRTRGVRH
jgi:PKD repeat protein